VSAGPAPEPDHAAALRWAASFREFRDQLAASLSAGSLALPDVLDGSSTDELLGETKLLCVLEALPGARKTDTRRTLDGMGIAGSTRLGALSAEQRATLLSVFPLHSDPPATSSSAPEKEPSS